jgi:alcohol dehydrogenase
VKAVRLYEFGGPEKLVYGEHPMPEVGPDDVLVKVLAIAGAHAMLEASPDIVGRIVLHPWDDV